MGVEKIVIEEIRHLLETAVEVLHLQVLGFAGTTDGIEEKADHHANRDDDGGNFGQEQAVLQQIVQHLKAPVEISSGIDRDHKQHDFTELPLLGKLRNEHITSDLAIWWMDHEENWDEHKATGYKRQRETLEPTAPGSRLDW